MKLSRAKTFRTLARTAIPKATKVIANIAKNVLPELALGVSSALASLWIQKLFGESILMPPEMVQHVSPFNTWTPHQVNDAKQADMNCSPF